MRVFFTFFCEHVEEGSYGRINFHGVLPQKQFAIPHKKYALKGYIVISMTADALSINKKLMFYKENNLNSILINSIDLPEQSSDGLEKCACFPLNWFIDDFGNYRIEIIFEDGVDNYSRDFKIIQGEAASLNFDKEEIPPQMILGANDEAKAVSSFKKIFKKARKSILVIDNFWTTKELSYLLSEIKPEIELSLFTKQNSRIIADTKKVIKIHPKTLIKSSNKIHDRYICLDKDSEIWHIGSSLNHAGKRLMTINKLSSVEAIRKLKDEINSIFPGTFPL